MEWWVFGFEVLSDGEFINANTTQNTHAFHLFMTWLATAIDTAIIYGKHSKPCVAHAAIRERLRPRVILPSYSPSLPVPFLLLLPRPARCDIQRDQPTHCVYGFYHLWNRCVTSFLSWPGDVRLLSMALLIKRFDFATLHSRILRILRMSVGTRIFYSRGRNNAFIPRG